MSSGSRYWNLFRGVVIRETLRFIQQRERFLAALVRPLMWLFVFAAGFRAALGVSIIEPYETYISYEVYILPGLVAMVQLFNGMQSSLSMIVDRELGSMRVLMVAPIPRWFILFSKLLAGAVVSVFQVYLFLAIAWLFDINLPVMGYIAVVPALILSGVMLGALGMMLSSAIKQLENFAGIMNFVIFPMFFLSSALYPIWKIGEASPLLALLCKLNPFTYAVEFIRFSLYLKYDQLSVGVVVICSCMFFLFAVQRFQRT
ncbi:MAG: ABC transporter permease subunit [Sedimenticola thiotaurini]|uniref:Transport permease protein n=1 Tax=Sedimenticola thiotaurini TaxID=1543721 RepID=A0A558CXL2_9GAMM|nr:MAG: ABC transporter permease subunit [Sedimenticola thiotaurini]